MGEARASSGAERTKTSASLYQRLCPCPAGLLDVTDKNTGVNSPRVRKNYRQAKGTLGTCLYTTGGDPHSPKSSPSVHRLQEGSRGWRQPRPHLPQPEASFPAERRWLTRTASGKRYRYSVPLPLRHKASPTAIQLKRRSLLG